MPPIKEISSAAKTDDLPLRAPAAAVALEVPVMVNGARAVDGSDKREPFSETTTTVLVMAKGAVIRLSVPVAPGQLLFLTNTKTRKEVVCQVVKSKNYRNVSGYVELEFTEAVVGFWGLRFPADRIGVQASAPAALPGAPVEAVTAEIPAAPVAAMKSNGTEAKSGPILTVPRAAEPSAPAAAEVASSESLKMTAARLQDQLSSMSFASSTTKPASPGRMEQKSAPPEIKATRVESSNAEAVGTEEIPPAKIPTAKTPAIGSTLNVEEVKIPSWLEPLARNAAAPVAPAEAEIPEEVAPPKPVPTPSKPKRERQRERVHEDFAAPSAETERAAKPAAKSAAAAFGSHLMDENLDVAPAANASRGGNKGILIGAFAVVAVLAAGAYWYMQPKTRSLGNAAAATAEHGAEVTSPAPVAAQPTQTAKSQASRDTVGSSAGGMTPETAAPGVTSQQRQASTPAPVSALGGSKTAAETNVAEASLRSVQPAEPPKPSTPELKKPNLGQVRLATPKMMKKGVRESAEAAPNLVVEGQALPSGDAFGNGLVSGSGNQPAAPPSAPIGGDVKPARLSVSQAPVYPAMARSQRVSGDVRIDALIDVNGRVSAMKVISGPAILHQAAMDALRHWKYVPAMLDGNPVPMHLTVTIQFRLQ